MMNLVQAAELITSKNKEKDNINADILKLEDLLLSGVIGKLEITALEISSHNEPATIDFLIPSDSYFPTSKLTDIGLNEKTEILLTRKIDVLCLNCKRRVIVEKEQPAKPNDEENDENSPQSIVWTAEPTTYVIQSNTDELEQVVANVEKPVLLSASQEEPSEDEFADALEESPQVVTSTENVAVDTDARSDQISTITSSIPAQTDSSGTTATATDETATAVAEKDASVASESVAAATEVIEAVSELVVDTAEAAAAVKEVILRGEVPFSELPADGSELRSQLALHLEGEDAAADSVKLSFKASYESTESQLASKRLELQQLEAEIASVSEGLRSAEKKDTSSSSTSTSSKKKKLTKKTSSKGRAAVGSRNVATAAGVEEVEPAETSASPKASWQAAFSGAVTQLMTSAGGAAVLAVDHRAVILFALSAAGIFFAGDYASV